MLFSRLAEYFEKLEETSSRLVLIDILTELFSQVEFNEIGHVSYLIQGRVGPFFEPLEIGMSEKLVAASIARAYGVDREEVLKEYGKVGDLGLVALRLSKKSKGKSKKELTTNEVFETLRGIAKTTGEGTVEKKVSTLSQLLSKVGPIGAKHLVRIPLGVSRLGIGDPTILDAFAKLKLGDRLKRKLLEEAYNRTSDLGLIGETLWSRGLQGIQRLDVTVGRPIRSQLAERLPTTEKVIEKLGVVNAQQKIDGFRVQLHKDGGHIRLFSRNLEETTPMFPEIVEGAKKQIKAKTAILDSEAIGYSPTSDEFLPFQETTQRRRKYGITEMAQKIPLKAFCFDILYKDGKSLIDLELKDRLEILGKTIGDGEVLLIEKGETVADAKRLQIMLDDAISKGLEGLVVKRLTSKYEAGARNFNWVKLKRHSAGELKDTIDCVILGYIFGRGKRAEFGAGALLVGVYDKDKDEFVTVSKIGTGLTDEEWREIKIQSSKFKVQNKPARVRSLIAPSVWVEPRIVIEILADEITRSPVHTAGKEGTEPGYALRFPRLVQFREGDKKAEDATTVKELIEMYQQQYKK
ncbi:ATP-dependent DNA ligase [Candidatus Daviesbacteria bacterium]|nr:ATP-dependent DNA ligase [Candidatus Daviesbacteria bacterium]